MYGLTFLEHISQDWLLLQFNHTYKCAAFIAIGNLKNEIYVQYYMYFILNCISNMTQNTIMDISIRKFVLILQQKISLSYNLKITNYLYYNLIISL